MMLGVMHGQLSPCPGSRNCVSSQTSNKKHAIEPFRYQDTLMEARARLLDIIKSMPRSRVVTVRADYVHAEFRSRVFGFVDDAEFSFDEGQKTIHLRSASRTGSYDFGMNRKRMERIHSQFNNAGDVSFKAGEGEQDTSSRK